MAEEKPCRDLIYAVEIDKCFAGTCVGMGLFFADVKTEREAQKLGEKRCREEKKFREEAEWTVGNITKICADSPIGKFIRENKDRWFVLK